MMPNIVRFLFTGNSVLKVIANTIQVEDIEPGGPVSDPPAGSMRVTFRQSDPGPVQICPLLPGTMRFLVDPAAPGVIPDPATSSFTPANVAEWKTRGRILVTVADAVATEIGNFAQGLPVKPNRIWYGPVVLTSAFLFETLSGTGGLKKATIPTANGAIRTTSADWSKHAIAAFLSGQYAPVLETAADATKDDRVRFPMPIVEVTGATNDVQLTITTALAQNPQDARDEEFENPPPPVGRTEPAHPRNGVIPAREVYRQMRPHMVADAAAALLMDAVLADWPNAPRFFPIRFTRTWEAVPNCSVFFPRQIVSVRAGAIVRQQPLPAHGIVYAQQGPPPVGQPAPAAPTVEVSVTGTMKWLLGGGTSWRDPGQTMPVVIDLGANPNPHISARLPMSEAMLSDATRDKGCGLCCTYMSLRRTVRALVDNRIAGGRLNFGVSATSHITRGLIHRAWQGTRASVAIIADNGPAVAENVDGDVESPKLIPVLEAFFPGDAPQFPVAGASNNPIIFTHGRMLHDLWHSRLDVFNSARERANFPDHLIGRGGPGTAVAMGIAAFHVDPMRQPGESDRDYAVRVTNETLVGLQPGAVLQFWLSEEAYEDMKARQPDPGVFGHSPIFVEYIGPDGAHTGVRIIDQNGRSSRSIDTDPPGVWPLLGGDRIWISANWTE